ncbi:MAG TPA: hypothetical protein VND99_02070 [Candidatus Acidoferrales bacterium]|nr:hypothetical protein [Candidatus Acidoferrales bacterium]
MKKKKEFPRKRKRYLKKIIYLSVSLSIFVLVLCGITLYVFVVKMKKPLYISPLPSMHAVQAAEDDKKYSELQAGLTKDQIDYAEITHGNNAYVVTLQNDGKVTFSTQKDIMSQIASLQYILSHLTMEGRQFSMLDLRFDKPVIVLKP